MEALKMSNWNDDRLDKRDQEIKDGFARLEGQMKEGFAKVEERFQGVDGRLAEMATRQEMNEGFARVDRRLEKVDERLAQMATREEMNKGFAQVDEQFAKVDKGFAELRGELAGLNRTLIAGAVAIIVALIGFHG